MVSATWKTSLGVRQHRRVTRRSATGRDVQPRRREYDTHILFIVHQSSADEPSAADGPARGAGEPLAKLRDVPGNRANRNTRRKNVGNHAPDASLAIRVF